MNTRRWLLTHEQQWKEVEQLLSETGKPWKTLPSKELRRMGWLYLGVMNDLSRVRSLPELQHLTTHLNALAQRLHGCVYETPPTRWTQISTFFGQDFPQCFRRNAWAIGMAFLVFVFGIGVAMITVASEPGNARYFMPPEVIAQIRQGHLWMESHAAAPSASTFLMTNNIKVAFNAYVLGISFGVGTLLVLFFNGMFALGGPLQICIQHDMAQKLLLFVAPHGVIELTTIFIAGGAGLLIGKSMLFPGDFQRWEALRKSAWESLVLIAGCVPLLIVAGIIEGMISLNAAVPDALRVFVSLLTALGLAAYLGLAGRAKT